MATVWRPTYTASDGTKKRSRVWRIAYTDEQGARRQIAGFRDKQATLAYANQLERNAERARAGMPVADLENRLQPLEKAIDAYLADLTRNGTQPDSTHYKECGRILRTLARECGWTNLANIRSGSFNYFLCQLSQRGRAPRTQNRYHETLRAFLNWCVSQQHWLAENPIAGMKMASVGHAGRRRLRRAYTLEEWHRLIAVAPEPRRSVYLVASFSGLRRSELVRLRKCDCTPTGESPRWHARAVVTKNKQPINLPMLPDCAAAMLPVWEAATSPDSPLFLDRQKRSSVPHITTLHDDLRAANIARKDDQGRWLDLHSFRYFFCKQMGQILPIQKVKLLMRHSTIKLTADLYGELGTEDVAEQVWTLPSLFRSGYDDQENDAAVTAERNIPEMERNNEPEGNLEGNC